MIKISFQNSYLKKYSGLIKIIIKLQKSRIESKSCGITELGSAMAELKDCILKEDCDRVEI